MKLSVLALGKCNSSSTLASVCKEVGFSLQVAKEIDQAVAAISAGGVEMLFVGEDMLLPAVFTALSSAKIALPVVVCGPAQPVQNAVKAIRLGAVEYLSTPLQAPLVLALIEPLAPKLTEDDFTPIYGDPKIKDLLAQAKQFAQSNASILLQGESGTGKEIYSQYIHMHSQRKDGDFIAVNCAAIPENLLESELFGHEKGAFSGAVGKRIGKFQQADNGTLLLDEISEMDLTLQAKLLRAIQEQVIDPVGSTVPVPINIRLIATTNRKLENYVAEGKFREDLYFRLNVVMIEIPPLRERTGDIMPLAQHFAGIYGEQNGLSDVTFTPEAKEKLATCYWKGNVRELENTIHRAILMMGTSTKLDAVHIVISPMSLAMMGVDKNNQQAEQSVRPNPMSAAAKQAAAQYASAGGGFTQGIDTVAVPSANIGKTLEEMERELILSTLDYCKGNRAVAADVLGISIKLLRTKLETFAEAV